MSDPGVVAVTGLKTFVGARLVEATLERARARGCAEYGLYLIEATETNWPFYEKFGFGRTEEDLRAGEDGAAEIFDNLLQITDLVCEEVGLPFDDAAIEFDYEPATKTYDEKYLIEEGTMAGLVVRAQTTHRGSPKATIEVRFLIGTDWVSPEFLAAAPPTGWMEVEVKGTPHHRFFHEMLEPEKIVRTRSTGTRAVNAIPLVCGAPPGLVLPSGTTMPRIF